MKITEFITLVLLAIPISIFWSILFEPMGALIMCMISGAVIGHIMGGRN